MTPDRIAMHALAESKGDFNRAVGRLLAKCWTREEAETEIRLCLGVIIKGASHENQRQRSGAHGE